MTPERHQLMGRLYHAALELGPQQRAIFVERLLDKRNRRRLEPGARREVDGRRVGGVQRDDPGHGVRHRGRGRGQVVTGGEPGPALVGADFESADLRRHPMFLPPRTDKTAWSPRRPRR